jgi:hypothetical protein
MNLKGRDKRKGLLCDFYLFILKNTIIFLLSGFQLEKKKLDLKIVKKKYIQYVIGVFISI